MQLVQNCQLSFDKTYIFYYQKYIKSFTLELLMTTEFLGSFTGIL